MIKRITAARFHRAFIHAVLIGLGALAIGFASAATATDTPQPFADEIGVFAVEDEAAPPPLCALLFVGSSSIRFWFDLPRDFSVPLVKRGFGGSTITDVNHYFDRLVAQYRPRQIVFYAGENDLDAGKTPGAAFEEFKAFLALKDAALGTTPVYFVSAKPSPARWSQYGAQTALNAMVRDLAKDRVDLVYVDVVGAMLASDGKPRSDIYIGDKLHMNRAGYAIWRKAIRTSLRHAKASRAPRCR